MTGRAAPPAGRSASRNHEAIAMQTRRAFIQALTALAAAAPFAPQALAAALPPGREFFVVDGWVLTRADVRALKLDAP